MPITSLYAALLSLLFIALSIRTIGLRRKLRIAIGDAGDATMLRAMRVHANFSEYVPLCLLMIYFVELYGFASWMVNALGICLLAGRLSHAYGVSETREVFTYRIAGMGMTFTVLATSAVLLLYAQMSRLFY